MKRRAAKLKGCSIFSILALAATANAQDSDDGWLRHFRIGASVGLNISTTFKTTGTFGAPNISPGPAGVGGVNRTYDDGFVGIDATGNASNATSNFGYNTQSQYDPAAHTLTYHGTKSINANGFDEVHDNPLGFDMVYGATFAKWDRVAIGGEIGFGLSTFQSRDRNPIAVTLTRARHQFSTVTTVAGTTTTNTIPNAPYSGSASSAGKPEINDVPTDVGDETVAGNVTGSRTMEGIMYNFRLGPLVRWEFYPRWTLNASGGAVLGIVDAEYNFDETITPATGSSFQNSGKFGDTDLKLGYYGGAVIMYDTGNQWEAFLGAHIISMPDANLSLGGREATMHLGAQVYLTAGINWSF